MNKKSFLIAGVFIAVILVLSFIFQMRLRGYKEIGVYDEWTIYENLNYTCESAEVSGNEIHYTNCNQHMLKNSEYEVFLVDMIKDEVLTDDEIDGIFGIINNDLND